MYREVQRDGSGWAASRKETEMRMGNRLTQVLMLAFALGTGFAMTAPALNAQFVKRHLYEENADPHALIAAALKQAKAEHKRVLLDFGGDWCGDCQVLDIYFHDPENAPLLEKDFVVVHIFTDSHEEKNTEVAAQYGVPLGKGVPALAVLDASGKVLHAQRTGEFNDMRHMESASVHEFLLKWKT
jgi:thiol:disulfide interchange protein